VFAVGALVAVIAAPSCSRRIVVTPFEIDGHPSAVTVVGDHVWVADDIHHSVHILDARTGKESRRPIQVSRNPIALAAGGGSVWIAHADGHVTAIDVRTRDVRKHRLGGSLTGVTYASRRVWLTDLEHNELVEIDPETLHAADRITVHRGAVRVSGGPGSTIWVTNGENTVTEFADGRERAVRRVGLGPIGIATDGRTMWVANSDDGTVTELTASRTRTIPAGRGTVAVAVVGPDAWAVNQDAGTLTSVTKRIVPPIDLGTHPRGATGVDWFGHREIWVVGSNPDRVVRVQL
jgi:DNA-binding beta-propeller fold protein YncE